MGTTEENHTKVSDWKDDVGPSVRYLRVKRNNIYLNSGWKEEIAFG